MKSDMSGGDAGSADALLIIMGWNCLRNGDAGIPILMAKQRVYRHDALCPKCGSNWVKRDGHSRGKRQYKCNQRRKRQGGAKHRFTDEQKEQAVKMCAEGMSLSATARVIGASAPTVSEWVKKGGSGERSSDALSGVVDKRAAG